MARFNGKNLVVMVENSSNVEVAFTYVVSADIPDPDYEDVEFMGDDVKSYQAGQGGVGEVVITYEMDDTATTGNHAVLAGIVGDNDEGHYIRVRPVGTGAGLWEYAMDAVLTKHGPTGVVRDGKLEGKAVFKNHTEAAADPAWAAQGA